MQENIITKIQQYTSLLQWQIKKTINKNTISSKFITKDKRKKSQLYNTTNKNSNIKISVNRKH